MKKLFSLFLATTALFASSASEYTANEAMRTTPLMIVALAKILPLYPKTIMSSSGTKGYDIVIEGHLQNGVNIENLKDENGPVTGKMVISTADLQGVSSKLNILGMTPLTDLHITGCSGYNNQYFKKISDNYRGLNLSIIFTNDVKWIVDGFLSYCPGLTTLDLSPLLNVTSIDDKFLSGCTGLTSVTVKKGSPLNETLEKPEIIGALPSLLKISIKD